MVGLLGGRTRAEVITNADDYKRGADRIASFDREFADLTGLGLEATELDLREYFGRPAELRERLSRCDLLWVRGGNPFILRRAFRQSGADLAVADLLAEDAFVYGGYSAGSCLLTPSLRGVELVDDPKDVPEGYDEPVIWDCLGIIGYSLLPHYKSNHPESDAISRVVEFMVDNHMLFVALRDGQALVRDGDREFIVG